jgi:hypothetical protein
MMSNNEQKMASYNIDTFNYYEIIDCSVVNIDFDVVYKLYKKFGGKDLPIVKKVINTDFDKYTMEDIYTLYGVYTSSDIGYAPEPDAVRYLDHNSINEFWKLEKGDEHYLLDPRKDFIKKMKALKQCNQEYKEHYKAGLEMYSVLRNHFETDLKGYSSFMTTLFSRFD